MNEHTEQTAQGSTEQAQPVWARPQQTLQWQQTPELEYHQLFRGARRYRWYSPVLLLVLGALYYLTLTLLFTLPIMLIASAFSREPLSADSLSQLAVINTQNPLSIFLGLGSIVLMIPAVWLAMLSSGLRPLGRSWSVALRLRWRLISRFALPTVATIVLANVVGIAIEIALNPAALGTTNEADLPEIDAQKALISMAIVLVLVPFQSTAEELVFRGSLLQSLGAWFAAVRSDKPIAQFVRGPWLPIAITAFIFASAHIYDIWGFLAILVMGIATGFVTWKTGGLEAAITLHVANNLLAFGFLALGVGGETAQTADSGGAGSFVGLVIGLSVFCFWVSRSFTKHDGRRTRIDWVLKHS